MWTPLQRQRLLKKLITISNDPNISCYRKIRYKRKYTLWGKISKYKTWEIFGNYRPYPSTEINYNYAIKNQQASPEILMEDELITGKFELQDKWGTNIYNLNKVSNEIDGEVQSMCATKLNIKVELFGKCYKESSLVMYSNMHHKQDTAPQQVNCVQ